MPTAYRIKLILLLLLSVIFLQSCATLSSSSLLQKARSDYAQAKYTEAFSQLLTLASKKNAEAQYAVGYMYYKGLGIDQDSQQALYWFRKSSTQGNEKAKFALSLLRINRVKTHRDAPINKQLPANQNLPRHILHVSDIAWIRHQQPDTDTIILITTKNPAKIRLVSNHKNLIRRLATYRFMQNKKIKFGLAYGVFANEAAAQQALSTFKPYLRKTAKISQFATIQAIMLP